MKPLLLLTGFALVLISCHSTKEKVVEVEFNVNKFLLADSSFISKTGFSISPPKKWIRTDSYNSELQNKVLYRLDNKLLAVYKADSSDCTLIISELPETNFDNIKRFIGKPDYSSRQDSLWTKVQSTVFQYKTYEVIQIVSQNAQLVVFKLFAHRLNELYELDYVIPRSVIDLNVQTIESSIGSLN